MDGINSTAMAEDLIKNSSESRDSLYENHDDDDRLFGGTKNGTTHGTNGTTYGTKNGTTNNIDSTNNDNRFYMEENEEDMCGTTNYGTRNSDGTENGTKNGTIFSTITI